MSDNALTWEQAVQWLKTQPDKGDLVRASYYDDPLEDACARFEASEEFQAVSRLLAAWIPGNVLDIGAGNGISSYGFARLGCRVTALEPDPSAKVGAGAIRRIASEQSLSIEVTQAWGESLPYADGTFDIVHGRQVLHHAADLPKLCAEAARVLRPGGAFLATREHVISRTEDKPAFLSAHPLHALYGGENAFLLSEYKRAISEGGLTLRRVIAPHESVVNYFPTTRAQKDCTHARILGRVLGASLGRRLAEKDWAHDAAGRLRSWRDHRPGRLYSFLALKPG